MINRILSLRDQKSQFARKLVGSLQTSRIITSLIVFASICGIGIAHGSDLLRAVVLGAIGCLVAMTGFAINDIADVTKDRVNAPYRAIPSRRITKSEALTLGTVCSCCAVVLSVMYCTPNEVMIVLAGIAMVFAYNPAIRSASVLKNVLTGAICVLPLLLSMEAYRLPEGTEYLVLVCFVFISGRELLMDIRDIAGDRQTDLRTLPVLIGKRQSTLLAFGLMLFSAVLLMIVVEPSANAISLGCLVAYFGSILAGLGLWGLGRNSRTLQRLTIELLKIPLIAGIVLIIS